MRSRTSVRRGDGLAVVGGLLVVAGLDWLMARDLRLDPFAAIADAGWPFFVIIPGVILMLSSLVPKPPRGVGFAIAGSIVTTVGLVLLYQEETAALGELGICVGAGRTRRRRTWDACLRADLRSARPRVDRFPTRGYRGGHLRGRLLVLRDGLRHGSSSCRPGRVVARGHHRGWSRGVDVGLAIGGRGNEANDRPRPRTAREASGHDRSNRTIGRIRVSTVIVTVGGASVLPIAKQPGPRRRLRRDRRVLRFGPDRGPIAHSRARVCSPASSR